MKSFLALNYILWIIAVSGRNPEIDEPVRKLIEGYGYPFEVHEVATADDYLLGVHRIPASREDTEEKNLPLVLMMHGLLGASTDWILGGPNQSLEFLLSDNGFDVWLPNSRGNTYSKDHKTLNRSSYGIYWDFSWHEMGIYDAPALIDYVLDETNHTKLFYIGFSQGCTEFFIMTSMKPEYNDKVILMTSLAPAAYTTHISGILKPISYFVQLGRRASEWSVYFDFLPSSPLAHEVSDYACQKDSPIFHLCELTIFIVGGFSEDEELNKEHLGEILRNTPACASTKQLIHYGLGSMSGYFRQYDYGIFKNLRMYNSIFPPEYDLSKVVTPISIYNGINDYLADIFDIAQLASQLPNVTGINTVKLKKLNHCDFLFAKDMRELAYERVLEDLMSYAKNGI